MAHLAFLHAPSVLSGVDLRYTTSSFWTFFQHHWQVSSSRPHPLRCCCPKEALESGGKSLSFVSSASEAKLTCEAWNILKPHIRFSFALVNTIECTSGGFLCFL